MRCFLVLAASLALTACNAAPGANGDNDQAFNERVHRYIVENPEVIEEALIALQQRARAREQAQMMDAVTALEDAITGDPRDPVFGPADAPVTIVEFFDYRCPYCRVANDWLAEMAETHDGQIRIVFKELPLLGDASREAARAALAVWKLDQDAYFVVHNEFMAAGSSLTSERIDAIAGSHGVDVAAMRETMPSDTISEHLTDVYEIASMAGINGTPFFIINGEVIPGADMRRLQNTLQAALGG